MAELIDVKWFSRAQTYNLSEIYQQTGMVFSFVSSPRDGSAQCHEWVKCRDFLADAVRTQLTKKPCAIYGFSFKVTENPAIDLNKMRMLVSKKTPKKDDIPEFKRKIKAALKMVNHFEKMVGVSKSIVKEVSTANQTKYKSIFLFIGSIIWLKSPFLVSMYSFLIRLGDKEFEFTNNLELKTAFKKAVEEQKKKDSNDMDDNRDNDITYLNYGWNKLDLIMKNRANLFPTKDGVHDIYWKAAHSISSFHNATGVTSLVRCITIEKSINDQMNELIMNEVIKKDEQMNKLIKKSHYKRSNKSDGKKAIDPNKRTA